MASKPEQNRPNQADDKKKEFIFVSTNKGLRQMLKPAKHDREGRCIEPPVEANFGGDTGKMGMWRTTDPELAQLMRDKMKMKTPADYNVTEVTDEPALIPRGGESVQGVRS